MVRTWVESWVACRCFGGKVYVRQAFYISEPVSIYKILNISSLFLFKFVPHWSSDWLTLKYLRPIMSSSLEITLFYSFIWTPHIGSLLFGIHLWFSMFKELFHFSPLSTPSFCRGGYFTWHSVHISKAKDNCALSFNYYFFLLAVWTEFYWM